MHSVDMLRRDMESVFSSRAPTSDSPRVCDIVIRLAESDESLRNQPEAFSIRFQNAGDEAEGVWLEITGSDELGLIYGILHVSRDILGVEPFWFWADRLPTKRDRIEVPAVDFDSSPHHVRYRGWFVNGEDCLIGWKDSYPPPREVWYPVFEALLRCGGNMVCPGTDLPRDGIHLQLAAEMGLYLTNHHAEPLGAEMFARRFPDQEPIYDVNKHLFEQLWLEAIVKHRGDKIIWTLGFRGQGDRPFWNDDPRYATPQRRGQLISQVIQDQYNLIRGHDPHAQCCTNLYGEILELFLDGHLPLPDDVIRVWGDNGYGVMVNRRQNEYDPRLPAIPAPDSAGPHGVYYHVNFHDLKASNQLAMLVKPSIVKDELTKALSAGCDEYLIVNSGNIRPHVYALEQISQMWTHGDLDPVSHTADFAQRFFPSAASQAADCYTRYFETPIQLGTHPDEVAGDEFYYHQARMIIMWWMKGLADTPCKHLVWVTGELPFHSQVDWIKQKCQNSEKSWQAFNSQLQQTEQLLDANDTDFFRDNIILQARIHLEGSRGLRFVCEAFENAHHNVDPNDLAGAFVAAFHAKQCFVDVLNALRASERGKWEHFYRGDWLTNVKSTVFFCDSLQSYLRVTGDIALISWYDKYLKPKSERGVGLAYIYRDPIPNDTLAEQLDKALQQC